MTVDEIRVQLTQLETCFAASMDASEYGLAHDYHVRIDELTAELIRKIQEEDPYTTEADIRYFEGL